jgi:hypothetical protein
MTGRHVAACLIYVSFACSPAIAASENHGLSTAVESKPVSEIWLNAGFFSYHFQRNSDLNEGNFGLGGEYRYSTTSSFTLGVYENSESETSRYAGWYWEPIGLGPVKFGAFVGTVDGYPIRDGGWFIAIVPAASIEYGYFGANLLLIPSYKDEINGSISLQLKLRLY